MDYKIEHWNPWTTKSDETPFKSTIDSVGDGEQKLGKELGVTPLGQNFKYDLLVKHEKWEVKKLDSENSFRLGVEVSSSYNIVLFDIINIFSKLSTIQEKLVSDTIKNEIKNVVSSLNTLSGRSTTMLLDGLKKNEVSAANLEKANDIIDNLNSLLVYNESELELYSSYDGKKYNYSLLDSFLKISKEDLSSQIKINLFGGAKILDKLLIASEIGPELQKFKQTSLKIKLNTIVRNVFKGLRLVLVHKNKGYKPIQNLENIYCNRITSGAPRCKFNDDL